MKPQQIRLGDLLVSKNIISQEQLSEALAIQKQSGRKLGRVLIDKNLVSEENIAKLISEQLGMDFVDLKHYQIKDFKKTILPESLSRRFKVCVIDEENATYIVGFADPLDLNAYDEVNRLIATKIKPVVVTETQCIEVLDRTYRKTDEIKDLANNMSQNIVGTTEDTSNTLLPDDESPIDKLLFSIFEDAIQVRASDIHIEPLDNILQIRFRIDGELYKQTEADIKIAAALIIRLKIVSNLDISEKRIPQDGRFNVKIKNKSVDVRLSTVPLQYGEAAVMRLLVQDGKFLSLAQLGMNQDILNKTKSILDKTTGMILVTGPTGSGKTTTLYACLDSINNINTKILTAEDPVEYRMRGINQIQVNHKIDLSFDKILRAALRQDPDIIMVGEIRDKETAETGIKAAITGHLVLSTVHTNDALSTPIRLIDMGVPNYLVSMSLKLIVAQRLIRTVCQACIKPYTPQQQEIDWLNKEFKSSQEILDLIKNTSFYHGTGCHKCNNSGYFGRIGVYEFLEITTELSDLIGQLRFDVYRQQAHIQMANNMLHHNAAKIAIDGRTTIAEAIKLSSKIMED